MKTLTIPKVKDIIHQHDKQYNDILSSSLQQHDSSNHAIGNSNPQKLSEDTSSKEMQDELASFLKDLKKDSQNVMTNDTKYDIGVTNIDEL